MRLQVIETGKRKWLYRLRLWVLERVTGFRPGPQLVVTYRPDLFVSALVSYIAHGVWGSREWSSSEAELFSAYISSLNSCHF